MSLAPHDLAAPVLVANGLSRRFGGVVAVADVSFEVRRNEVVGIIGPNGSGKTTLFNLLSGFLRPRTGTVTWNGRDITGMAPHRRARLGLVRTFQQAMVFPRLDVRENAALALRAGRAVERFATPEDLVEYVDLGHVLANRAGDLSWGQTRLLGIALALAASPQVLLLDEPFAGLSPVAADDVSAIVRKLKGDGYSLAVIDHELSHLLPICDRLVVLANGVELASGNPSEVVERADVRTAYLGL
ncbi:MAG: ABC transporter ATP-binding protein [Ilumatobacteraceae bacterium]